LRTEPGWLWSEPASLSVCPSAPYPPCMASPTSAFVSGLQPAECLTTEAGWLRSAPWLARLAAARVPNRESRKKSKQNGRGLAGATYCFWLAAPFSPRRRHSDVAEQMRSLSARPPPPSCSSDAIQGWGVANAIGARRCLPLARQTDGREKARDLRAAAQSLRPPGADPQLLGAWPRPGVGWWLILLPLLRQQTWTDWVLILAREISLACGRRTGGGRASGRTVRLWFSSAIRGRQRHGRRRLSSSSGFGLRRVLVPQTMVGDA
jgi:hypothetical protein